MNIQRWVIVAMLVSGCAVRADRLGGNEYENAKNPQAFLREAEQALEAGEYYRARKMTAAYLKNNPTDGDAQILMAQILDREISSQKELLESEAKEELTPDERSSVIRTWIERARALLNLRQYDQAVLAAEKVFLYDAENGEASRLIDEIKAQAYREGKKDGVALSEMRREEIQLRIKQYRLQAEQWIEKGQWGAARLTVEKILLLQPEDQTALRLLKEIKSHSSGNEAA